MLSATIGSGEQSGRGINVTELQQSGVGVGVVVSGTDGDFAGVGTLSAKVTPEDGGFELVIDNQQWLHVGLSGRERTVIKLDAEGRKALAAALAS
jgi:hypothetical protein